MSDTPGSDHDAPDRGSRRVVVMGQGYVGLPLALALVGAGDRVVGFDIAPDRALALADGCSGIPDVADAEVTAALASGRYRPTADPADLAGFDVAVIAVPTPLRARVPDLSYVEAATDLLGAALGPGALVVLESTTYPGTTEELVGPRLRERSGLEPGRDFLLGYSPERIDPANPTWDLRRTPKVVSGIDEASRRAVEAFYGRIVERTVSVSRPREAEMVKLLENTFRHVNIGLVNELAQLAAGLDVDIWEVVDAASTKPFGFMPFRPGAGVGGHCLPIDPSYLSWASTTRTGHPVRFVELANQVNGQMPAYVVSRVADALAARGTELSAATVAVVGYAYKRDTNDAREAPARDVADLLLAEGATVLGVDPHVDPDLVAAHATRAGTDLTGVEACDAAVLVVAHSALDLTALAAVPWVLDTCGVLEGPNVERL